jgi:hypothetical protein
MTKWQIFLFLPQVYKQYKGGPYTKQEEFQCLGNNALAPISMVS